MSFKNKRVWLPVVLSASVAVLSACGGSDDDEEAAVSLWVANDQGDERGVIRKYLFTTGDGPGMAEQTIRLGLAEGIAMDAGGHVYQNGILANGAGAVRMACAPGMRGASVNLTAGTDRNVTTALGSPKGSALAQQAGYILVAETGSDDPAVSLFSTTATNAMAAFTVPRARVGDSGAWDVAYDEASDK
ncbi:MAG: hypothetical protein R3E95_05965 [Thiolinea sp.]